MKFSNKNEFMDAVREFTIQEGREIKFRKNESYRVRAICKWTTGEDEDMVRCPWVAYAFRDSEETCWQLKTFKNEHICPRMSKNRAANRRWLAGKLVKKLRRYPSLKHSEAKAYFRRRCDLDLNKSSLTRALMDARNIVYGDAAAQYGLVRDYAETLLKSNPGSTVKIGTYLQGDDPIFEKMYVCLDGCKKGFKAGCRPLIGLDGAFLKTRFGGQLSAVAQDANNHIYPIAWAIVDVENKENWRWFLDLLLDDLGDYMANKWASMSDMQKGLASAVKELMPNVHHRFCVWHLWKNFNKKWKEQEYRGLLWDCARETTRHGFDQKMDKLKRLNEGAWAYLDKWPREAWTRAYFRHDQKIDNICNNACEVFNSRIKEYRAKPIITLLEEVRMFTMRSIAKNKVKLSHHVGKLPPIQHSRLQKIRKESQKWTSIWSGDEEYQRFEIHGWPTNMAVDLGKSICTCRFWQITGMPCVHACAAISKINRNSEDFCHYWLTMKAYRDTYKHSLNPIPGQDLWERSEQNRPLAPKMKRKPRSTIQKRWKDADEEPSSVKKSKTETKLKRKYKEFTCTYYGTRGHTKRSCFHRKVDDLASALVSAAAAVVAKEKGSKARETRDPANAATSNTQPAEINENAPLAPGEGVDDANASEIDLTQPTYSQPENQEQVPPSDPPPPPQQVTRPDKLQSKRKKIFSVDPMQGATSGTAARLAEFMTFVPTPGFKPPTTK
ncbi:uncharacterized protein LOC107478987 [Arachis duranensis]|uniref:Uncharacterized protein LOC107478987 n=1 Tax=Arachis duranensis TaxID=130453 RepID=A0A6P4CNL1_ARADU|nr:uncharacterized protein LOC107478987 [Arachis duranensis]